MTIKIGGFPHFYNYPPVTLTQWRVHPPERLVAGLPCSLLVGLHPHRGSFKRGIAGQPTGVWIKSAWLNLYGLHFASREEKKGKPANTFVPEESCMLNNQVFELSGFCNPPSQENHMPSGFTWPNEERIPMEQEQRSK